MPRNLKTPRFEQRHYEFIADLIAEIADDKARADIMALFVPALKADNPKFLPEKFRNRCLKHKLRA